MNHRAWLLLACWLPIAAASCREKPAPSDTPLPSDERGQFEQPLRYAAWQEEGSWPQFCHDPLHSGRSDIDLGTPEMELAWRFQPTTRAWAYEPGFAVWSSPAAGTIHGRPLIFAGSQDRNVYAIDARTGEKAWEFHPGSPVFASPALGLVAGRPMVFVASMNRSIYGLDAAGGNQIWQCETAAWSFTAAKSVMSSPTPIRTESGEVLLLVGVWNADRSAARNVQTGECLALIAETGKVKWRRRLSSTPVTSPAFARLHGREAVFVTCQDGTVHALKLQDGMSLWTAVLNEESRSSSSIGIVDTTAQVFVGSRLNTLFGLYAATGTRAWRGETGYWVDSTPAWFTAPEGGPTTTTVVAGSYDRNVYAWTAGTAGLKWRAPTGNYAYSSPAVVKMGKKPVILMISWDEHLYLFEGATGRVLWRYKGGPLLWSHAYMGDSLWASPVAVGVDGRPTVLFPAFDGVLYAFRPIHHPTASVPAEPRTLPVKD
jgi:outer membrane protein assembly factor BamB